MEQPSLYRIPATRTLVIFESAARHCSFSQAARELGITQSAASRQIATLEAWASVRLFERRPAGVSLTEAGTRLYAAIANGLGAIHRGLAEAAEVLSDDQVIIACPHGTSQFLLQPRFNALCDLLGEHPRVRVMTYDQDIKYLPPEPVADIVFTWDAAQAPSQYRVTMLKEAVRPVCSPEYADSHREILIGPVTGWDNLTYLDYTWPNKGWSTWSDWFEAAGHPERNPKYVGMSSYAYVLEAAVAGRGIALGWQYFVDQHLAAGTLVALGDEFVEFDNYYFCVLTDKGRGNPAAYKCLQFFEGLDLVSNATATQSR